MKQWSAIIPILATSAFCLNANASVLISEVLYDAPNSDSQEEWVELYNSGCSSVDLSNYAIRDNGATFQLSGTIGSGEYITIAKSESGFSNLYSQSPDLHGMTLSLSNSGDYVELLEGVNLVDMVAWENKVAGWSVSATNTTIYRTSSVDTDSVNDWANSGDIGTAKSGSLSTNCQPATPKPLIITEVLYDAPSSDSLEEYVELFNPNCNDIPLAEYSLSDNVGTYVLSGSIKAGSYFVAAKNATGFTELTGKTASLSNLSLSLGNSGDTVKLSKNGTEVDMVAWEGYISGWTVKATNTAIHRSIEEDSDSNSDWAAGAPDAFNGIYTSTCDGSTGGNTGGDTGNNATDIELNQYYSSVIGLTGNALKSGLNELTKGHTRLTYDQVWAALKYTDEDPDNTENVILFYTGRSQDKDLNSSYGNTGDMWNREHIWPKSHGFPKSSQYAYTDIQHLRPADASVNSTRSNKDYDVGGDSITESPENRRDSDSFEPRDAVKGDAARMIFYMDVRYEGNDLTNTPDLEIVDYTDTPNEPILGKLCTLLSWHNQDPVDEWEIRRHARAFEIQKNRNPFIDNPDWANELYSSKCN